MIYWEIELLINQLEFKNRYQVFSFNLQRIFRHIKSTLYTLNVKANYICTLVVYKLYNHVRLKKNNIRIGFRFETRMS